MFKDKIEFRYRKEKKYRGSCEEMYYSRTFCSMVIKGTDEVVGTIKLWKLYFEEYDYSVESLAEDLDCHLHELGELGILLVRLNKSYKDDSSLSYNNTLYVQELNIKEKYRGQGIGAIAVKKIKSLSNGMQIILKAYPTDFNGISDQPKEFKKALKRLRSFWESQEFERIRRSYFYLYG
jgi:GNAT superfamily N-acetyltransferase